MHVVIIFFYVLQVFDIVFVIQNKGNHHFPSSCDSAVTYAKYVDHDMPAYIYARVHARTHKHLCVRACMHMILYPFYPCYIPMRMRGTSTYT